MASSGFNFGKATTTSTPIAGGGPLGTLSFGVPASTTIHNSITGTPQIGFGTANLSKPSTSGLGFGVTGAAASATTNISFGSTTASTTAAPGLNLSQPAAAGFSLGATTTSTVSKTGFQNTSSAPSFSFAKPTAAVTTSGGGFGFGLKLSTATTTSSTGLVGLGFGTASTSTAATGTSIFGQTVSKTVSSGLGGVDPKTTTSTTSSDAGKPGDGKAVKETAVENNIMLDVDELSKFVKEEKSEMEQMKRLSSTPMVKVQEDNAALKQLLSVVSSGLQRNACAVDKLKKEMTQELKNAEMAIRTKETPPGLQYENVAPTQYFQCIIENFETQMVTYRQQIEMLENHLASLHQPNRLTHEELILLLRKLHEAFIAMAAQLQQIHESVKTQKEHYLNYRKVFHGDGRNIFERQRKAPVKLTSKSLNTDTYGQSPFPGINNTAAVAMATALTRTQQPQAVTGAPPVTRFVNFQPTTRFGNVSTGFGTSGLGSGISGFGVGTDINKKSSEVGAQVAGTMFTCTLPKSIADQSFQLARPPGSKRGKR